MNIVIAIDSFKGSMSSLEAANAAKEGILRVYPHADIKLFPLADGGEGTIEALVEGMGGYYREIIVKGPLFQPVNTKYGIIDSTHTAIIEIAKICGLPMVPIEKRNPLHTTTYGIGEVIIDAIKQGCRNFIIGLGGSATNDGGIGMLSALGVKFYNQQHQPISLGAKGLYALASIDLTTFLPELTQCHFQIACDVDNPLCGKRGASAIFGPQKGAIKQDIRDMDKGLHRYASLTKQLLPHADDTIQGCGAAGGLGFAFLAYLNGSLTPGIDLILKEIQIENAIKKADIVITGEGRLDEQTIMGKAPIGVAKLAKKHQCSVIAFCGSSKDARVCNQHGIDAYFPILRQVTTLEEAMNRENAKKNMTNSVEQVFLLLHQFVS